jgi:hypothetical protein
VLKPLIIFLLLVFIMQSPALAGRCTGSSYCGACSTCNYCKHCNGGGGTCGVCGGGNGSGSGGGSGTKLIGGLIVTGIVLSLISSNKRKK